jgi:hypothetical protein
MGFNHAAASLPLREPAGRWSLHVQSGERDFGGEGQEGILKDLVVTPEGTILSLPAYTVAVYLWVSDS